MPRCLGALLPQVSHPRLPPGARNVVQRPFKSSRLEVLLVIRLLSGSTACNCFLCQLLQSQRSRATVQQQGSRLLSSTFTMGAGIKTIIGLSFVLAVGFLLVILSSAIWHNFLPLIVVATYVVAPLPNWICSRCANPDDFIDSSGNSVADFGRFLTGFLVLMGVALPAVLAHSGAIEVPAMVMSIIGGLLIYGTIISFSMFFQEQEEF